MELRPKPYQNHVLPTKHKVIMRTKSHVINQPTHEPIHTFHFIFNMETSHPYLISCNIHDITHQAFVVKHSIKQTSNHIREPNRTRARTCPSLAKARSPRSDEPFSPRRELEQGNNGFYDFSFRRDLLA